MSDTVEQAPKEARDESLSGFLADRLDLNPMRNSLHHQRLDPKEKQIRLLKLEGNHQDELKYTMFHVSLNDRPDYCALSYYWGAMVRTSSLKPIKINDTAVRVRPTLYEFLRILAIRCPQVALWTDVVCINQTDIEERNSQVSMMGEIYSTASIVYAWLGEADADTDYAFDHVCGEDGDLQHDKRVFSQCIEHLLWRPYWTRMWVIQEFGLAQRLFLICGSRITEWQQFDHSIKDIEIDRDDVGWQRLEAFRRLRDASFKKPLIEMVVDFGKNRCLDKRDKVYSLRSLADDGNLMTVDYTQPVTEVVFRLLSMYQPVAAVKGYIPWQRPFESISWGTPEFAQKILECLQYLPQDLIGDMEAEPTRKLSHWIHFKAFIGSSRRLDDEQVGKNDRSTTSLDYPSQEMNISLFDDSPRQPRCFYYTGAGVEKRDLICSLSQTCECILLVMRSENDCRFLVDIALDENLVKEATKRPWQHERNRLLRHVCLYGIEVCCANTSRSRYKHGIDLVHISRGVLLLILTIEELLQEQTQGGRLNRLLVQIAHRLPKDMDPGPRRGLCNCQGAQIIEYLPRTGETYLTFDGDEKLLFPSDTRTGKGIYDRFPESVGICFCPSPAKNYQHTLFWAAKEGLSDIVQMILMQDGTRIDAQDEDDRSPLLWAAAMGHEEVVKVFISQDKAGMVINLPDRSGWTPLAEAALAGHEGVIKLLVAQKGIDINRPNGLGDTPLSLATRKGHENIVELLISYGARSRVGTYGHRSIFVP